MSLRINDTAPDFTAVTSQGVMRFHEWIGDSWAILLFHPKDVTPVRTTEPGYMAQIQPAFTRRDSRLIGLSVNPVAGQSRWASDIEETQGHLPAYPIMGHIGLKVAKLYNMLPAAVSDEDAKALFPQGWKARRPYLRIVRQPS